jgi:hypothetical protein
MKGFAPVSVDEHVPRPGSVRRTFARISYPEFVTFLEPES